MKDLNRKEPPLIEGGQGRSGADLEIECDALTWYVVLLVIGILVTVGAFA